ncbi:6-phosphofructokinase [Rubrobacter taiwanensis]|nr:6-phosphofructokinase [Rubrobacter taiwanensis]
MRIAVLTSGGDAPGMNGAIRGVTRTALERGWEVWGVENGYEGLLEDRRRRLDDRSVGGILHRGGTVLGTARSKEFVTPEGQRRAAENLLGAGIGGLVVIGGEGSLAGAQRLFELGIGTIGIPATIDNDVPHTEMAVGVDTALNTALESIDRIKDTASSHQRAHVVEVMGRNCGYLALMSAIAGGAEAVLVPEFEPDPEGILEALRRSYARGKPHFIVVAAEGAALTAAELHEYINRTPGAFESRLTVLGHVQRGGSPLAYDRILSGRMGAAAVEALVGGETGVMIGLQGRRMERIPLPEVAGKIRPLDPELYELAQVLAGLSASGA